MKVNKIEQNPGFTPITITIELESIDDLADLWHRTNLASADVIKVAGGYEGNKQQNYFPPNAGAYPLWAILDKEMEKYLQK